MMLKQYVPREEAPVYAVQYVGVTAIPAVVDLWLGEFTNLTADFEVIRREGGELVLDDIGVGETIRLALGDWLAATRNGLQRFSDERFRELFKVEP